MVAISPTVDLTGLQVFYTTDPLLSNGPILVFYGSCQPANSTMASTSRIQTHVFAAAGLHSFPRLVVSPISPLYSAVTCLPREDQGDEVCRALAFSVLKYFTELPEPVKEAWLHQSLSAARPSAALNVFKYSHAADLARRMTRVENAAEIISQVQTNFALDSVSHIDIDLVLPTGSVATHPAAHSEEDASGWIDPATDHRYGAYTSLIAQFGEPTFLPTSKIRRAPSRPAALNRSPTFSRAQKESLRLEMNQLVDTEQSYVDKLSELMNNIVPTFSGISIPDDQTFAKLFPPSLTDISNANAAFLTALKKLLQETNDTAITDIERTTDDNYGQTSLPRLNHSDSIGILTLAKLLLEWFPKFSSCYSDYIKAHVDLVPFLRSLTSNPYSALTQHVQSIGEQRLMSMLIEPVQRLPRYSLYIDNIVKQLPIKHPALRQLLKAKDIISNICHQDQSSGPLSRISRIKQIIPSWPATFRPQGRFILAVDAVELYPPFDYTLPASQPAECLILLFAGHLVRIKKLGEKPMTARSFMTAVETSPQRIQSPVPHQDWSDNGLLFSEATLLNHNTVVETASDKVIRLVPCKPRPEGAVRSPSDGIVRTFLLQGTYDGRVARWAKEHVKAKVEGRFSETQRESRKWEAYSLDSDRYGLGLFTAVFENESMQPDADTHTMGAIRILVDPEKDSDKLKARHQGVEIVISVLSKGEGFYWLEIDSTTDKRTRDLTTEADFLPVLIKRLGILLQNRQQIRNPPLTIYLLQHNSAVLNAVKVIAESSNNASQAETQTKRTQSPVKKFTNLFGNKSVREAHSNKEEKQASTISKIPNLEPRHQGRVGLVSPLPEATHISAHSSAAVTGEERLSSQSSLTSLEETLSCYVLALQARKGNVIGSIVNRRALAEETEVNKLYNGILENPGNLETAAQSSVDVLFAAFEKFVKVAWQERLGPIITSAVLADLQNKMEHLNPFEYDEYSEQKLSELAPQNRRALSEIVGLLAHLLDGMRNDGDRGALTAAITEIVISDGEPQAFIDMFDKLVETHDVVSPERPTSQGASSGFGSVSSRATRSTKPSSISSKASSLSKRLGIGSLKGDSGKQELHSKGSLRRLGSRKALPPDPPVEKPVLGRAKSTDLGNHFISVTRPGSRDRVALFDTPNASRPTSAHSRENRSPELSPARSHSTLRKKRRSSLSDLTTLETPTVSPFWTGSASKQIAGIFQTSSRTPSPTKHSPTHARTNTETSDISITRRAAPPLSDVTNSRDPNRVAVPNEFTQPKVSPQKGILSERVSSGNTPAPLNISPEKRKNINESPTKPLHSSPSKKLRVQSPTKLGERLEDHHNAIKGAESSLKAELAKIGEELAATNPRDTAKSSSPSKTEPGLVSNLNTRLKALETKVSHLTRNLNDHATTLSQDLHSSLQASENRARALDAEFHQAKAENDALYARMNEETMKVFEQLRDGNGVEELKRQLNKSFEETDKWRKEVARLKRENLGLSSQLTQ